LEQLNIFQTELIQAYKDLGNNSDAAQKLATIDIKDQIKKNYACCTEVQLQMAKDIDSYDELIASFEKGLQITKTVKEAQIFKASKGNVRNVGNNRGRGSYQHNNFRGSRGNFRRNFRGNYRGGHGNSRNSGNFQNNNSNYNNTNSGNFQNNNSHYNNNERNNSNSSPRTNFNTNNNNRNRTVRAIEANSSKNQ
jgi:hypothetical protein